MKSAPLSLVLRHALINQNIPFMITYTVQHWSADAQPFAGLYQIWRMAKPSFDAPVEALNV
jgi:hypothetical protein